MIRVEQPGWTLGGCGIATLAMVTGRSYADVLQHAPALCERCGVEASVMDAVLAELGYAVMRFYPTLQSTERPRFAWPVNCSFAALFALVLTTPGDTVGHYVAIDGEGTVFDPAENVMPFNLSKYHSVEWIAAVIPVR